MALPTAELLRRLFSYNSETGDFIRLVTRNSNARAGQIAGTVHHDGYVVIHIDGKLHGAHRLAWLYMTGDWPEVIDHRNGVRGDNSWGNLRNCGHSDNIHNEPKRISNRSGHKNVSWCGRTGKWTVQVMHQRKAHMGGRFDNLEEAISVAAQMRNKLHGEFANHGILA